MDNEEFRRRGQEMIDFLINYTENIRDFKVIPNVDPGFLYELLPHTPPEQPEKWEDIMDDVNRHIVPGMTLWQHPQFHAYFPTGNAYPAMLGELFAGGTGSINFSWVSGPAATELEIIILDWLAKMFGLPDHFLYLKEGSKAGGVIQNSASESILVCLLAARYDAIQVLKKEQPNVDEGLLLSKLMAYTSTETHSSFEKAAMIAFVKFRELQTDEKFRMRGSTLAEAIKHDRSQGYVPFFVLATHGTTSSCAFDAVDEIGPICHKEKMWLHVDGAYAGSAWICPEFRYLLKGFEYVDSVDVNPMKWLLATFDVGTMWVRDRAKLIQALSVDPVYLQNVYSDKAEDFRHWEIPLGRRFRSIKLWFIIRNYGVSGLRKYIREHIRLAKIFESLVRGDDRFEVIGEVIVGLVCFRLKGSNLINEKLLSSLNQSRLLHMIPTTLSGKYTIRFCVCCRSQQDEDIVYAWKVISEFATDLLANTAGLHLIEESTMPTQELKNARSTVTLRDQEKKQVEHRSRSFFVRMVSDPHRCCHFE